MKISDIKEGDSEINVEGEIVEKSYAREVRSKYGYHPLIVADATLKDESGKITLTLWNEQVSQVKVGDKVIFGKYAGTAIKIDGEELLIMREDDIVAVMA